MRLAALLLVGLLGLSLTACGRDLPGTIGPEALVLYETDWCGYCRRVEACFRQNGIDYESRNIERSSSAHKEFRSLGGRGVPVLVVNGEVIHGFDARGIKAAMARRGTPVACW